MKITMTSAQFVAMASGSGLGAFVAAVVDANGDVTDFCWSTSAGLLWGRLTDAIDLATFTTNYGGTVYQVEAISEG